MTHPQRSGIQLRRAVLSSYLGSMIEFYDFLLYATASAVVFNKVFFSNLDPLVGTVASFGTLATGYFARPLGGLLFGHFGDRIGRKKMLIWSMALMGVGSTLIGLLPTYAQIGALAPILLVLLRVVQGIAIGGEWGGAVLMSAEHASSRRGLWASFTASGAPSGMVLSTLVLALAAAISGEQGFLEWGWRIPFVLSIVLLAIGLFVRARVDETPVFTEAATSEPAPAPVVTVLRDHPRNLLLAIGTGVGAFLAQGTLTVFVISYAVQVGFARPDVLNALTISSVVAAIGVIVFSSLSDRFGRRPVVVAGALAMAVWAFVMFPLIDSGSWLLLALAVVVGQGVVHACWFGPLAALYSELFPTRARYTGASLGYQISGIGAGLAPLIFASVLAGGGTTMTISVIIAVGCLLSVGSILALSETVDTDLTDASTEVPVRR
jgi:MFS family permease